MSLASDPQVSTTGIALRLEGVSHSFGRTAVLRGLDLTVPAGQFLAVVGRSGSGKSTLLRLLCGLDAPTAGRILFDGAPTRPGAARMMFQEPRLLPWARIADNVAVGLETRGRQSGQTSRVLDALRAVGLAERAREWPTVLSGGQKQRVALARALVSRPSVLLLDEPLGALDALTRLDMQDLVQRAWQSQGMTVVLVTHDVAEAVRLADRVLVLEDGRITFDVSNEASYPRPIRSAASVDIEQRILARLMER